MGVGVGVGFNCSQNDIKPAWTWLFYCKEGVSSSKMVILGLS